MNEILPKGTSRVDPQVIEEELAWCERVMDARFEHYFAAPETVDPDFDVRTLTPPALDGDDAYSRLVAQHGLGFDERLVLIFSLVPHLRPQLLDLFFLQNKMLDRAYTEFGGVASKGHTGFLPTCETVAFLLGGRDLERRLEVLALLEEDAPLRADCLIRLENGAVGEPFWCTALRPGGEVLDYLTTGTARKPDYGTDFPAKRLTTSLSWDDLVLAPETLDEVVHLRTWMESSRAILDRWNLERAVRPGYRCLFYGPPGTGKTLTASLIGASAGVDVYRIDLSMVVSKYIGETEKNLAGVFDQAQRRDWILFFDEADALFGKRTQASSSNDRHANQEVAYLLQRVEDFPGMVILATNLKSNIDEAFARRFQSILYFPMPGPEERLRLWQGLLPDPSRLEEDVDLEILAEEHELAGGALINVVRYAAVRAFRQGRDRIGREDLKSGLGRELMKEGRTL